MDAPCDKICFVGSPAKGRKIAQAAAKHLTPVVMELGGQDAAIVCDDADLDVSTSGVLWSAFFNAGQTCSSIERVYVTQTNADEFREQLLAKLAVGFAKPAGVFRLTRENWAAVMDGLPTDALWGIGAKTAPKLAALGIHTVRQLAASDEERLARTFGPTIGPWLVRIAQGRASARVSAEATGGALAVRLFNMTDYPGMKDMLQFLIARDTMHQQQWLAAIEELGDDVVFLPAPDFGHGSTIGAGSWQWAVSASCPEDQAEVAQGFIEYLLEPEQVAGSADAQNVIPGRADARPLTDKFDEGGALAVFYDLSEAQALIRPPTPAYTSMALIFEKAAADIANGADVQTALDAAVDEIDADIAANSGYGHS
jgi:hypothetical protein